MENPFSSNSYYILGLSVSADQSEIKKRSRLISAQLGIGEENLNDDLNILNVNRTEDSLKNAVQRLSSPNKKVQDVFFWFSDGNLEELRSVINNQPLEDVYSHISELSGKGKWNEKRDLAIYLTLLLLHKKTNKKYLEESLLLWRDLITSDLAWKYFNLYFKNIDDLNTSDSTLIGLRKFAEDTISDIYSNLSEKWGDHEYSKLYTKIFGKIGTHTQKNVLNPSSKQINDAIDDLFSIRWHDESPSKENLSIIKSGISKVQDSLNALIEADLYEESEVVVLRDKASEAIRSIAIDLTNKYNDYERSAQILAIAEEISGTQSTKNKNQNDKGTVEENRIAQKLQVPVLELLNEEKYVEAVNFVHHQIKINRGNKKILVFLEMQLTAVISRYISEERAAAMDKVTKGDNVGITMFEELRTYISDNLDRFELNLEKVEEIIDDIDIRTAIVTKAKFDELAQERDDFVKSLFEKMGDGSSTSVLVCLIDCAYYVPLGKFLKISRSKNHTLNILFNIGWWTLLINGFGLLFLIPAFIWQKMEVKYVRE